LLVNGPSDSGRDFSGNAAAAASDLRDEFDAKLFALAIGADADGEGALQRLVGREFVNERLLSLSSPSALSGDELINTGRSLCGQVTAAAGHIVPVTEPTHSTTKRDVDAALAGFLTVLYVILMNSRISGSAMCHHFARTDSIDRTCYRL
jgi:hypothetical protein